MTYIKLEQKHADDARWIEAGADAFALHVAALVYCDRQLLDGCISRPMALRVSLAVPPDRAAAAVEALVSHGFWQEVATGYLIANYEQHAFPAEQIQRTRDRWKHDKDRRRQHDVGDHSLCKDPKFCPAVRSTMESTTDAISGGSHLNQTQPDQTQPDRREGVGVGVAAAGSAGAPHARPKHAFTLELECCPLPPENPVHELNGHRPALLPPLPGKTPWGQEATT
jgi:hypothetical protein